MNWDSFLFPAPKRKTNIEKLQPYLIWIPVYEEAVSEVVIILIVADDPF